MFSKILSKKLMIPFLAVSFIYGLALPFFWGNDPTTETGTLSLLCEDRKAWFWAWAILIGGGIILNTQYMFKKYSFKHKFFDALSVLSTISIIAVAATIGHSTADWNAKRLIHWIATGLFITFVIANMALFFIVNAKKEKHFVLLTLCTFGILATFFILFLGVGKSALMEMIPVAMIQIMLFVVNFTPLLKTAKSDLLTK